MSLRHFEFLLQETLTGLRRNAFMSVAAVSTIAVSLSLLGTLRLVTANLDQAAREVCRRFEMRVFLEVGLDQEGRNRLWKEISAMPGVAGCRLVTREEAGQRLRQGLQGDVDLSDLRGSEWLPESFVVRAKDVERMGGIASAIVRLPGVDEVVDTRATAEQVARIARLTQAGGAAAVGLLILAAAVIVGNTIRLTVHARRAEIRIMQLVGATNGFVRAPFLLEGACHGVVGALVALGVVGSGYSYAYRELGKAVPFLELLAPTSALLQSQAGSLVGIGLALGVAASYLSVRKYLRA